jgi:hypothetical protein
MPVARQPAVTMPVTSELTTRRTPSDSQRATIAEPSVVRPPGRYQPPKASSAYGTAASAAGARRGSVPVYVAYRSSSMRRRGSSKY